MLTSAEDRGPVQDVNVRAIVPADLPHVVALFDTTMGAGFWGGIDLARPGVYLLAEKNGELLGAATGTILEQLSYAPELEAPVGMVELVAVSPDARGEGIATLLADAVGASCLDQDAASLAAFAWVHAGADRGALAGVLERLGYARLRRLEDFYAGTPGDGPCPACGENPCVCMADLYVR